MIDIEALIFQLLTRAFPTMRIAPEHEVDEIEQFPIIMFTLSTGGQLDGTVGKPLAWDVQLSLSVFHKTIDEAKALAGEVYDAVWLWDSPWEGEGVIAELGHAAEIEDQSVFTRVATVEIGDGRSVTQYEGRFGLQAHAA